MELPLNYIIEKFYQHVGNPKYRKSSNVYNGSCPICREGNSWLRKKRCFFLVNKGYICCHNCQQTWSPIEWIKRVTGLSFHEVVNESNSYDNSIEEVLQRYDWKEENKSNRYTLPYDCINLSDQTQLDFYKKNTYVKDALRYITERRLDTAGNRVKTFYISLKDKLHRNRLVIPFYNEVGQIVFYQSRALNVDDEKFARYLSKVDSAFTIFGIERINIDFDYIFLFEGPIDSMFVKNGVGMGGLTLNDVQAEQIEKYYLHNKIWVLDNQPDNAEVNKKYKQLIDKGETVFIYPDEYKQFKDLNELCMHYKIDQVSPKFIIKNSYSGMKALLKLKI